MWKLRHWLHSSLPDSFFLSFFFFPSLVLLSLSLSLPVPRRCVSLALFSLLAFFLPPLPCLRAWEHCRPLSSQFPFLTSSATSSVYAERGFLLHRHRELSNLKGSRRAHIFSHICFFPLSLSLPRKTSLSFHPLLFVCGFSPPRLGAVFLAAPYLSQLILSFGLFINWLILKKNLEFFYWIINWIKVLYTKLYW